MNSSSSIQQVVAELIGKKTYRPLVSLRIEPSDRSASAPIVKGLALYRKSLQIIPSGPYTLRFAVDGIRQEYTVRVANKTLIQTEEKDSQAA